MGSFSAPRQRRHHLPCSCVITEAMRSFAPQEWLTHSSALLDQMAGVTCLAGATQIGKLITHALQAGSVNQPVRALVFVGDACEEGREYLWSLAGQCGIRKLPLFLFQEGHDAQTRAIFQELARLSGGATIPFDAGSAGAFENAAPSRCQLRPWRDQSAAKRRQ